MALLALLAAACGGSDDDDEGASAASPTVVTNKATGDPIVIGAYAPAESQAINAPEVIAAASAAVDYVNTELGGVNGRPLDLQTCTTRNTADSVTACANELLQKKPLLVIGGSDSFSTAGLPLYEAAGVPVIGGGAFSPQEMVSENRTMFNAFSLILPGMAHFAINELEAESIAYLTPDGPMGRPTLTTFLNPVLDKAGLPDAEHIAVPVGTADYSSSIAAAAEDADAILAVGVRCAPVMQAWQSLGQPVPLVMPGNCGDPNTLDEVGATAEGVHFVFQMPTPALAPDDPDVELYVDKTERYSDEEIVPTDLALDAFASVLNIRNLLETLPGDQLTSAAVQAAVRSAVEQDNFLGQPYTCAPAPIEAFPAVCAGGAGLAQMVDGDLDLLTDFIPITEYFDV